MRTRSIDIQEAKELSKEVAGVNEMSPEEWRKDNHITIKPPFGAAENFVVIDPILEFSKTGFDSRLNRGLISAGFDKPTTIQSQVRRSEGRLERSDS